MNHRSRRLSERSRESDLRPPGNLSGIIRGLFRPKRDDEDSSSEASFCGHSRVLSPVRGSYIDDMLEGDRELRVECKNDDDADGCGIADHVLMIELLLKEKDIMRRENEDLVRLVSRLRHKNEILRDRFERLQRQVGLTPPEEDVECSESVEGFRSVKGNSVGSLAVEFGQTRTRRRSLRRMLSGYSESALPKGVSKRLSTRGLLVSFDSARAEKPMLVSFDSARAEKPMLVSFDSARAEKPMLVSFDSARAERPMLVSFESVRRESPMLISFDTARARAEKALLVSFESSRTKRPTSQHCDGGVNEDAQFQEEVKEDPQHEEEGNRDCHHEEEKEDWKDREEFEEVLQQGTDWQSSSFEPGIHVQENDEKGDPHFGLFCSQTTSEAQSESDMATSAPVLQYFEESSQIADEESFEPLVSSSSQQQNIFQNSLQVFCRRPDSREHAKEDCDIPGTICMDGNDAASLADSISFGSGQKGGSARGRKRVVHQGNLSYPRVQLSWLARQDDVFHVDERKGWFNLRGSVLKEDVDEEKGESIEGLTVSLTEVGEPNKIQHSNAAA